MNRLVAYGGWAAFAVSAATLMLHEDDNARPRYGDHLGLPDNCRAYVNTSIAGYRSKHHSAEETMLGLERNCGAGGQLWKQ